MMRRIPSMCALLIAFAFTFVVILVTPCSALEEDGSSGFVVNRPSLDFDEIKPGDDDQPTISGRRRGAMATQTALPNPGAQPDAGLVREPDNGPSFPGGIVRTWIENLRVLIERIETLR